MGSSVMAPKRPATPQIGTPGPVQVGSQMLGGTVTPNTQFGSGTQGLGQWGQAHLGGMSAQGGVGAPPGGYKPMPFNVNMGQGLGASVGTTPNTMFPPRPADYGMNMTPHTLGGIAQQRPPQPGIATEGPGFAPSNIQGGDVGMVQTGKQMSKGQQLAHVLKGMGR